MQLTNDSEVRRELVDGEVHEYELTLESGQFVQLVAYQLGVDVAVELYDPDEELVLKVDSPTGRRGPERLLAVVETAGTWRLKVPAAEPGAPQGEYRLVVEEWRPATAEDRQRAGAERLFSQAEELRREGTEEARRQAIERYQEALDEWRELGERGREADALLRLGWVHRDLRERNEAAALLIEAREIYREIGEGYREALALNHLASMWIRLREYHAARPLIEEALEIARGIDNTFMTAECLNNLGIIHRRLSQTDEALVAYMEALDLYEEFGEPPARARIRGNIGILLVGQGKLREAADHLETAIEIWSSLDNPGRAALDLSRLGDVRRRQQRLGEALQLLERALDLRRQADNPAGEATTLNDLGTIQLLREDFEAARGCYDRALEIFREQENRRQEGIVLLNLGRLHIVMGQPGKALEFHELAAPLIEQAEDRAAETSNLYGMARALHDLGDFEAARQHLEETLEKVEDLRAETASEGLRIAFFASRQHYYELHVDVLMHLHEAEPTIGYDAKAFAAGERRRARALLEALGENTAQIRQHAAPELLAREKDLQAELNELEDERTNLIRAAGKPEEIDRVAKRLRATNLALDHVRGRFRAELSQPKPCSLADTRYLLQDGTLLLAYSLGNERSFLWRVSEEKIESYVLPDRDTIETLTLEAQELLISQSSDNATRRSHVLAEISNMLLGHIATELDGRRLAIVPEGALLYLPFAALPGPEGMEDPCDHLVECQEIVYQPSVSVLRTMRQQLGERYPAPRQLAIFANPVFEHESSTAAPQGKLRSAMAVGGVERFQPLPHTLEEAEEIRKIARGDTMPFFDYDATKTKALDGGLAEYQILHFATHGVTNRAQPELSGLVLSLFDKNGESLDGFLRLHEIYSLHLPAELVVLSACQTGIGREVRGEGFLGLTRGFMYAGTPRLVVSLWNVDDRATAELMKRFYWSLLEAQAPPALALRAAQMDMLRSEDWNHPFYWAGFVFQGEWWPPGEEPPIEEASGGGEDDTDTPVSYPGPDTTWCKSLAETWMQELCHLLRSLGKRDDG